MFKAMRKQEERKLQKENKMVSKNKPDTETKNYISFFQSATTIGIVSSGKNAKEAQEKSEFKMKNSDPTYSVIAHEPFTLSTTEEWVKDMLG